MKQTWMLVAALLALTACKKEKIAAFDACKTEVTAVQPQTPNIAMTDITPEMLAQAQLPNNMLLCMNKKGYVFRPSNNELCKTEPWNNEQCYHSK
jgi:hypothetical protein